MVRVVYESLYSVDTHTFGMHCMLFMIDRSLRCRTLTTQTSIGFGMLVLKCLPLRNQIVPILDEQPDSTQDQKNLAKLCAMWLPTFLTL
jgi:hypothetical protein